MCKMSPVDKEGDSCSQAFSVPSPTSLPPFQLIHPLFPCPVSPEFLFSMKNIYFLQTKNPLSFLAFNIFLSHDRKD